MFNYNKYEKLHTKKNINLYLFLYGFLQTLANEYILTMIFELFRCYGYSPFLI